MLAQAGDGAFLIDERARIVAWNHAAERILGHSASDVLGRRCCEIFDGRDQDENRICYPACRARTLLRVGDVVHPYDVRTTTKAGATIWLNVSVLSMPPVTVHLFRDVTAQRRLLQVLQERLDDAPRLARSPKPNLSERELEVLKHLVSGTGTTAIARGLCVSPTTIRNHVQSIFRKLGVHSRLEAITLAMRHGWC